MQRDLLNSTSRAARSSPPLLPAPSTPRSAAAFSLVELIIVIVAIGVIAAIAVPRFSGAAERAKRSEAECTVFLLQNALDAYIAEHDAFQAGGDHGLASAVIRLNHGALTMFTRADHSRSSIAWGAPRIGFPSDTDSALFGPYLHSIPANPLRGACSDRWIRSGDAAITEACDAQPLVPGSGWVLKVHSGAFLVGYLDDADPARECFSPF